MNLYPQALKNEDYETRQPSKILLLERGFKILKWDFDLKNSFVTYIELNPHSRGEYLSSFYIELYFYAAFYILLL